MQRTEAARVRNTLPWFGVNQAFLHSAQALQHTIAILKDFLTVGGLLKVVVGFHGGIREYFLELIPAPLQGVLDLIRESLQCALRNGGILFILLRTVGKGYAGNDYLGVGLRALCTRLKQTLLELRHKCM